MPHFLSSLLLDPRLNKLRYGAAIFLFLAIVAGGSIPGARADIGHYASGVVLHSSAYAVLALLWFTASRGSAASRTVATVLAIAVMGAIDESVQSFFPYRGADVRDWMVDCSAAVAVSAILWLVLPKAALQRG
ncbi:MULTISPECIES: VanZ family protein [unclassified Massilia]|uniref:VanZ family protein n=1 Tax=unclassified Massilia TaxID=2609279 RepID=UPI00177EE1D9|nr:MULTISPECIES: VanZ family protein [unclassified Massilia]MBD8533035.1 VanZ family protein [Massilia sp. CFBP 13647]MBD8676395.1 VanZ family protein [Massilia sp. CFBP 13721]